MAALVSVPARCLRGGHDGATPVILYTTRDRLVLLFLPLRSRDASCHSGMLWPQPHAALRSGCWRHRIEPAKAAFLRVARCRLPWAAGSRTKEAAQEEEEAVGQMSASSRRTSVALVLGLGAARAVLELPAVEPRGAPSSERRRVRTRAPASLRRRAAPRRTHGSSCSPVRRSCGARQNRARHSAASSGRPRAAEATRASSRNWAEALEAALRSAAWVSLASTGLSRVASSCGYPSRAASSSLEDSAARAISQPTVAPGFSRSAPGRVVAAAQRLVQALLAATPRSRPSSGSLKWPRPGPAPRVATPAAPDCWAQ